MLTIKKFLGAWKKLKHPVFLFHGCIEDPGVLFRPPYDNITPDELWKKLVTLKKDYDFVPVDVLVTELRKEKPPKDRLCALTIDDGYQSILDNACPILQSLNVPASLYIYKRAVFSNQPHWPDLARLVDHVSLANEFDRFLENNYTSLSLSKEFGSVRKWMKSPRSGSHRLIRSAIKSFCDEKNLNLEDYCASREYRLMSRNDLAKLPQNISVGIHGAEHLDLTKCTESEVKNEINGDWFERAGFLRDDFFALPFGRYSSSVFKLLNIAGYRDVLLHDGLGNVRKNIKKGVIHRASLYNVHA